MSAEINKDLYRKYRGELNALTFNAKPAITNLTKMADRYKNEAATILSALEDHLRMTSPHMKLPAFYLLDSIAKMVGGTYLYLLNSRVQKLFLDTWQSVNDEVKAKLERVLMTWRNGFEGGKGNLFQPFVLRGIDEQLARLKAKGRREAAIPSNRGDDLLDKLQNTAALARKRAVDSKKMTANGGGANGQPPAKRMRQYNGDAQSVAAPARQSARVRNEGLWQDVNKLLLKKQVEQLRRSNDPELFDVVAILGQIKQLVAETDLPSEQIQTIRNQLAEIDSGVKPQTEGKRPNGSTNGTTTPPYPPPAHLLTPKAPAAVEKMEVVAEAPKETKKDRSELVQNILANTDLMNSLSKMMPSMAAAAGSGNAKHAEDYSRLSQLSQLGAIALTHHSVIRSRPGIHRLLYAGYPNVCKQCGWRCTSDESGKAQMDTHLDWHFRRNRRSQEDRVRKAGPRGWYVDTTTWEHAQNAVSDDPADTTVFGGDESEVKNMGVGDLQASTVVAPANHSSRVCPVCKESFEPRFNEDEEEWELVNATMVGDDIYHATCVADRQALSA